MCVCCLWCVQCVVCVCVRVCVCACMGVKNTYVCTYTTLARPLRTKVKVRYFLKHAHAHTQTRLTTQQLTVPTPCHYLGSPSSNAQPTTPINCINDGSMRCCRVHRRPNLLQVPAAKRVICGCEMPHTSNEGQSYEFHIPTDHTFNFPSKSPVAKCRW